MSIEDSDKNAFHPDLTVADLIFRVSMHYEEPDDQWEKDKYQLEKIVESHEMLPLYQSFLVESDEVSKKDCVFCPNAIWLAPNVDLVEKLKIKNEEKLKKMDEDIAVAEKEEVELDVRDAHQAKADYLAKIGDKVRALACYDKTLEISQTIGHRMDINFAKIRIGLFFLDYGLVNTVLNSVTSMMEKQGDWDRRNRLKVYQGFYAMSVRDFELAAKLFLDTSSTFTASEIVDYDQFIVYTVYMAVFALDRQGLAERVVCSSDIAQSLRSNELGQATQRYLVSLYACQYAQFFTQLAYVERKIKFDRYLHKHYAYYVREMKCRVIGQLLESYKSLTIDYLAETFDVSPAYIQDQLASLIAEGKLHCKIDNLKSVVITTRPVDSKNEQYQATIKQGDVLLNRIQKLSRVINY